MKKISFATVILVVMLLGIFGQSVSAQTLSPRVAEVVTALANFKNGIAAAQSQEESLAFQDKFAGESGDFETWPDAINDTERVTLCDALAQALAECMKFDFRMAGYDVDSQEIKEAVDTGVILLKNEINKNTQSAKTIAEFFQSSQMSAHE